MKYSVHRQPYYWVIRNEDNLDIFIKIYSDIKESRSIIFELCKRLNNPPTTPMNWFTFTGEDVIHPLL